MQFIKNIAFFGSSEAQEETELYKTAFQTAQLLAKKGYVIINGGGPGVMDASTQGAESVKGETIAITFYPKDAPGFEGRYPKNITDKEIETGNYIERTFKMLEHGDIYIFFKGGTGTFSEFAMAWCLARLYFGVHKPFILYGQFWQEIVKVFKKNMLMRGEEEKIFKIVTQPADVLEKIAEFEQEFNRRHRQYLKSGADPAFSLGVGYRGPDFATQKGEQ